VTENELTDVFPSFEDCYRAAYMQGLGRLSRTVRTVAGRQDGWLERVRCGLVALLGFFDDHPSWARLLLLEGAVCADVTFECRRQLHDVLTRLLNQRPPTGISAQSAMLTPALTGELVVGGVFSVIGTSLLDENAGKLVELAPSLMAFIVGPYLGQASANAELTGASQPAADGVSAAAQLPVRPTQRTLLVLDAIGQAPRSNNREVAAAAGIGDEGQTSKLLARLEGRGVIENVGVGAARGEPNAWLLTATGHRALALISASATPRPRGAKIRGEA
jgi:AcrR family transcriptional regulator